MPGCESKQATPFRYHSWPAKRLGWIAALALLAFAGVCSSARAQEPSQDPPPDQPANAPAEPVTPPPPAADVARVAVHGSVKNAATGEPLARALVRIEGDAVTGRLTDGDGRFEIPGVPVGPQAFQVIK